MIKDILKDFDDKFDDYWWTTFNIEREKQIKQFISDKLKQAMESVVPEKRVKVESPITAFEVIQSDKDHYYNIAIDQIKLNISKYFEV